MYMYIHIHMCADGVGSSDDVDNEVEGEVHDVLSDTCSNLNHLEDLPLRDRG